MDFPIDIEKKYTKIKKIPSKINNKINKEVQYHKLTPNTNLQNSKGFNYKKLKIDNQHKDQGI